METKLILNPFGSTFGKLRRDEKSFFHTLLGFTPYWDFKTSNAIHVNSPGVNTSDEKLNLSAIYEILLKPMLSMEA